MPRAHVVLDCPAPEDLPPSWGFAGFDDLDAFLAAAWNPPGVDAESLKFIVYDGRLYFSDWDCFAQHAPFTLQLGCPRTDFGGALHYRAGLNGPAQVAFEGGHWEDYTYADLLFIHSLIVDAVPFFDRVDYMPESDAQRAVVEGQDAPFSLVEDDLDGSLGERYRALNPGRSVGTLRFVSPEDIPLPTDIAVYDVLPNNLPRVAGIVTTRPQTPLSHIGTRAAQDGVPNAFIADVSGVREYAGRIVSYEVTESGATIEPADAELLDAYLLAVRPTQTIPPNIDLSVQQITPLDTIGFDDSAAFGAKAANVGELRALGVSGVPDGLAVPFYFYDAFMQHNGFYARLPSLSDADGVVDEQALEGFRDDIRGGEMPDWMLAELAAAQSHFGGASFRCRSSASNEDQVELTTAGLYNSYTHHPHEGHLSKSIKQVYASLFTRRAFIHREFNRIEHDAVAMGVLLHPNFENERVNGVAVSYDMVSTFGSDVLYLNAQIGEDLVTNPDQDSLPEEVLVARDPNDFEVPYFRLSGGEIISGAHILQLRDDLLIIDEHFQRLYGDAEIAIEIEFKVTADGMLAIKQARPRRTSVAAPRWDDEICDCRCPQPPGG